jgi:lipoprotein signal peptidase
MMSYPIFNIFDCAIEIAMTNSKCLMATLQFQENILFNFVTNKMR